LNWWDALTISRRVTMRTLELFLRPFVSWWPRPPQRGNLLDSFQSHWK